MKEKAKRITKAALALLVAMTVISGNVSAAIDGAGWDTEYDFYGSRLNWTRDRFKNYTTYWGSTGGMNYSGNDQSLTNGATYNYRSGDNEFALAANTNVPVFRWGYYNLTKNGGTYNWIQYSQGFSDIEIDLSKDFALGGTMKIGSDFGRLDRNSEGAKDGYAGIGGSGLVADGGLTIALIPTNLRGEIIKNAGNGLSGVQRLGAYGVFKNSIIMEFDVGHQNGYSSINGNESASFFILNPQQELKNVGDWKIYRNDLSGLGLSNYTQSFYDKNKFATVASQSHIGISVTDRNDGYVKSEQNSSERRFIWGTDTGNFDYKIEYRADTGTMMYSVRKKNTGTWEYSVSYTIPSSYRGKRYTVASSFSAIYQDHDRFTPNSGGYFNGARNANANGNQIAPGQMELTIEGVYSQPDLSNLNNQVAFMKNPSGSVSDTDNATKAYQNGYISNTDGDTEKVRKRSVFPLEGDRVVLHNEVDISSMFNEAQGASGSLQLTELNFRDLKFVNSSGGVIGGVPPGLDQTSVSNMNKNIKYYYSVDGGSNWKECKKTNKGLAVNISGASRPLRWRAVVTLPKTSSNTNSSNVQFWLTGDVIVSVKRVGGSTATFNLPLYKENSERVTFFSNPKDVESNGISKTSARIISTSSGINTLNGKKDGSQQDSVSYGVKVWYNSSQRSEDYKPDYDLQDTTYSYKTIEQIVSNTGPTSNTTKDANINLTEDTRYIVNYSINDSQFNSNSNVNTSIASKAQNPDRAKSDTTRVIWKSDKVSKQGGYEFYLEPEITMNLADFDGFEEAVTNGTAGTYYQKIAKAANAAVFDTNKADWNNLANTIVGTGNHAALRKAISNPGDSVEITLRYPGTNGNFDKTLRLTIQDELPKVVSNTDSGGISDEKASKVIFDREDYTISATFKMTDSSGANLDLNTFEWNAVQGDIKVALYKKNGDKATGNKDAFYRWANRTDADTEGSVSQGKQAKVDLPATLKYNNDGTFTVTYRLLNSSSSTSNENWIQSKWEDNAQWRIYAWTDANKPTKDYSSLKNTDTDKVALGAVDNQVPSVTTVIKVIEKDNGNIPSSMFEISNVRLTEDPETNELINKDPKTTISVKRIDGADNTAKHDYYYTVEVADTKTDASKRPYVQLTQASTGRGLWATYLRYDSKTGTYKDVTTDDKVIGKISYNPVVVDGETINSSIRFGMRANILKNLSDKQDFTGNTSFTFTRYSIGGTGA